MRLSVGGHRRRPAPGNGRAPRFVNARVLSAHDSSCSPKCLRQGMGAARRPRWCGGRSHVTHLTVRLSKGALAHIHVNWLLLTKVRTTVISGSRWVARCDDRNPGRASRAEDEE